MNWLSVPAACAAFVVLVVLPGFGLLRLLDKRLPFSASTSLLVAMAVSIALLAGIGTVALVVGAFAPGVILVPLIALGVFGVRSLASTVSQREIWPPLLISSLLSLPWAFTAADVGHSPVHRFQWYYWGLGKDLTQTGGIPDAVTELGLQIRWLPDYLYFNVLSESYRALLFAFTEAQALTAWRYPMAVLGYLLFFLLFRLWVGRLAAYFGLILLSFTSFFPRTFDVYKPEAFGIIVGIIATCLVVVGMRRSRPSLILLGGGLIGINLGIHAIAAAAFGTLIVAAALTEWLIASNQRRRLGIALISAAVLSLTIALTSGLLLQGRALVTSDALHPVLAGAEDPTWTYLNRSAGQFEEQPPPEAWDQFTAGWRTRLDGVVLTSSLWLTIAVIAGVGIALARGSSKTRIGIVSTCLGSLLLSGGIAFFLMLFDTYVPRHTGAGRLLGYAAFYATLLAIFAFSGIASVFLRSPWRVGTASSFTWQSRSMPLVVGTILIVLSTVGFTVQTVAAQFAPSSGLPTQGREALRQLSNVGTEGEVVLSNVGTAGVIEFFTNKENPLESRQPLIEDPELLDHANDILLRTHHYFTDGASSQILDDLDVRWLLIADSPALLGGGADFGGSIATASRRLNLDLVWEEDGIAIFEVTPDRTRLTEAAAFSRSLDEMLRAEAVGSWTFDQAALAFALDASGSSNHGELNGASKDCTDTPQATPEGGGCSLQLDGVDDSMVVPSFVTLNTTDAFTMSMSVKQTGSAVSQYQRLTDKAGALTVWMDDQVERICIRLAGTIKTTDGGQVCFRANFERDEWYHITITYDGSRDRERLRLYVDGSLIGASDEYIGPLGTNEASLIIGNRPQGDRPFHGLLDDIRIYSESFAHPE